MYPRDTCIPGIPVYSWDVCHYMSLHVITCHYMSLHVITCHYMSLHVITCHYMSLYVITCRYMSLCHHSSSIITPDHPKGRCLVYTEGCSWARRQSTRKEIVLRYPGSPLTLTSSLTLTGRPSDGSGGTSQRLKRRLVRRRQHCTPKENHFS